MATKRTDAELKAEYAAKIARIDEREANRKAREASKEVRKLERDLAAANGFLELYSGQSELRDIISAIESDLLAARAAVVKP